MSRSVASDITEPSSARDTGEHKRNLYRNDSVAEASAITFGITSLIVLLYWGVFHGNATYMLLGTTIAAYAVMAQGLAFQYGVGGQLSVAQGSVGAVGAYVGASMFLHTHTSWVLVLLGSVGAGIVAGAALGALNWRISGHHFVIVTFAVAVLVTDALTNLTSLTGGSSGLVIAGHEPTSQVVTAIAAGCLVAASTLLGALRKSSLSFRLRASASDHRLAATLGIRVRRDRMAAFGIAGAFGGLGGAIYGMTLTYIQPEVFTYTLGITLILVILVGGADSVVGPIAGCALVVLFPQAVSLGPTSSEVSYGAILLVVIIVLPMGIVGGLREYATNLYSGRLRIAARVPFVRERAAQHSEPRRH